MSEATTHAARTILTRCLDLPERSEVVIFADETTLDVATVLAEAAVALSHRPYTLFFSFPMQQRLGKEGIFPGILGLLDEAAAALVCLSSRPEGLAFRDQARQAALDSRCRVAHMPGINLPTLLLADVDYELLTARCEILAQALAKGQEMVIVTREAKGDEHRLVVPLQPWERLPIISDGLIQRGSWGNVPSGETYIAPPEGRAAGSIVINGSIPGHALGAGEEVILYFRAGRLVEWTATGEEGAEQHLLRGCLDFAQAQADVNWRNLAEVGLGANPKVAQLTGSPLLDEKKYGTIHVALGDNIDMGGYTHSEIHCDLVTVAPEVWVDGCLLIAGNEIVARPEEWYEDFRTLSLPEGWHPRLAVRETGTESHTDEEGRLRRTWDTSSGKVCSVPVGNDESARLAGRLYRLLHDHGYPFTLMDLATRWSQGGIEEVLALSRLLQRYRLLKVVE